MDDAINILLILNKATDRELRLTKKTFNYITADKPLRLHIVYVAPNTPTSYFHIPSVEGMVEEHHADCKASLERAGQYFGLPATQQWLATGNVKTEALLLAEQLNTNFILASAQMHKMTRHLFGLGKFRKGCAIETISDLSQMCFQTTST
jgi:hypothetical protein